MPDSVTAPGMALRDRFWLWMGCAVAIVVADQLTKAAALALIRPGDEVRLTDFFSLIIAFNSGAAFSFLADATGWQRYLFSALAITAAVVIVFLLRRGGNPWYCLGLALILGGALGNLWDRLSLGHVVDFLLFHYKDWYYPAFNVADSAITVGAAVLILDSFKRR